MAARIAASSLAKDLGERNVAMAFEILRQLAIPVQSHDVGGTTSRKLRFHTADGRAWVRHFGWTRRTWRSPATTSSGAS
jgi:chemotaxis receptor (MCP) glutamine deamidase CheD